MVSVKTKSALIAELNGLVGAVGDAFESSAVNGEDGDAERDFMAARCPGRLEGTVRSLPTLGMHLLDAIGEGPLSVVALAERSGRLKGTVSKHVQRLVDAGLVLRSPIPGNRKELSLSLTEDGAVVVAAHRLMHDEMNRGMADFLKRYTAEELGLLARVLTDLLASEKVGVRLKPPR
jgi:DNA-binding MarR family transcriptional regulator